MQTCFVGIDSGSTSAFAVLDVDGRLVEVSSSKKGEGDGFLFGSLGKYSLVTVACDTNPPSKAARRLKRTFGCRLYFPKNSLSTLEKEVLCRDFRVGNSHERDALASVLKYYRAMAGKLRQLSRRVKSRPVVGIDAAARRMISGERIADILR